jgi:hypothetical protein
VPAKYQIQMHRIKINTIFFLLLFIWQANKACSQPIQFTLGTGTSYNSSTGYPAPYGNFYWGARHQFLIRASELQALGATGQRIITALGFNVFAPISGALVDFQIKLKQTTLTAFPTTGFVFETGTTTVFGPTAIPTAAGWNMHNFQTPFIWNGTSNILVEICFNNNDYTTNAQTYFSATSFGSSIYIRDDAVGVCVRTSVTRSTNRPNMRLTMSVPLPPVARITAPDTVYVNRPVTITSQSENAMRYYWRIDPANTNTLCNNIGCFTDTVPTNITTTFTQQGLYKITLINRGYLGDTASAVKFIYADTTRRKPKANFFASTRSAGVFDQILFYDSSMFGAFGWEWSINPPCVTCGQFPNVFTPSVDVQQPILNTFDPGLYDICLVAWNDKGFDTICKPQYINILSSFFMCNGTDSFTNENFGMVTDVGGAASNYQIGQIGQCNAGFVINPETCADTLLLYIDKFRLRDLDTLEIRSGTSKTGPIIARYSGGNLSPSQKSIKIPTGSAFMRMKTGAGTTTAGDSGFAIRWSIAPAAKIFQTATSFCPNDSMFLKTITRSGRNYQWTYNGQSASNDSFIIARDEGTYGLTVSQAGCAASNQITLAQKEAPQVIAIADSNMLQCVGTNAFTFINRSTISKGSLMNTWIISDGTQQKTDTLKKTFSKAGVYQIIQSVVSDSGCVSTNSYIIRVKEKPDAAIIYSQTPEICSYDSLLLLASSTQALQYEWFINGTSQLAAESYYAKAGQSIRLRVTDMFGCDSLTAPLVIKERASPSKPIIVRNGAYLQAITGNSRIAWYLGVTALSDTSKQIIPPQDGLYMVVSDSNGCIATSNRYVVTFTRVTNALEQNQVRVYPNPFSDVLRIESTLKGHYMITDITGRICKAGEIREGLNTITTTEFKAGVYILHIDKTYIRIVKQ